MQDKEGINSCIEMGEFFFRSLLNQFGLLRASLSIFWYWPPLQIIQGYTKNICDPAGVQNGGLYLFSFILADNSSLVPTALLKALVILFFLRA